MNFLGLANSRTNIDLRGGEAVPDAEKKGGLGGQSVHRILSNVVELLDLLENVGKFQGFTPGGTCYCRVVV